MSKSPVSYIENQLRLGLQNARIVVIGGRGGVGSEVVNLALEFGAKIIIGSRSSEAQALDVAELEQTGKTELNIDVTLPDSVRAFAKEIDRHWGAIDILVNSAGSSRQAGLDELDDALVAEVFHSNAIGMLTVARETASLLKRGTDPVIVNLGSIAARTGGGSNIAYVGAKAAVDAMSIGLAKSLAPEIRVVTISPSALDTDFAKGRDPSFLQDTIEATPLRRLTSLREVACAVLAAARLLTATTGVSIAVDGGRHL